MGNSGVGKGIESSDYMKGSESRNQKFKLKTEKEEFKEYDDGVKLRRESTIISVE